MSNELISVVIPCYNLAGYTRKCMDSIIKQTYTNLEIIVIDDGSTDETPDILAEYAKKDKRVVLISQANAGAGEAVNRGIEFAHGEYLAFVDNDDWIAPDMYERLHSALTLNNANMSVCNFNLVYSDHTDFCYSHMREETVEIEKDIFGYFCSHCACPKPNNYTWTRLYKTKIIKESDVRFESFRLGADTLFNFKLLPYIKRATFIKDGLYYYVQRNDSSVYTAAKRGNIAEVYADGFESLAEYYISKGLDEFCQVLPIHAYTRLRSTFFYSRLAGMTDDAIKENIEKGFKGRKIMDYLTGALQ
ncbi:MAG: glycosyltransferase [Hungatella sp.]|nr:glycosyltransferase [Hungatella sp.]